MNKSIDVDNVIEFKKDDKKWGKNEN
jgi:hypothetical protein